MVEFDVPGDRVGPRVVRLRRAETGEKHGSVQAVAAQLGFGSESVRAWVRQADIDDGVTAGTSTADADRIKQLEQELKEVSTERASSGKQHSELAMTSVATKSRD